MNYFDFVIIFFLVLLGVAGYFRGALREVSDILITGVSFWVAALTFQAVSLYIHLPSILPQSYDRSASFFLVWFFLEVILYLLLLFLMNKLPLLITDSEMTRYLGPLVAVIKGVLLLIITCALILLLPLGKSFEQDFSKSLFVNISKSPVEGVSNWFTKSFSEVSKSTLFISAGGSKSVRQEIGYKITNAAGDSASATKLGQIVNDSRVASSLDKLKVDDKLSELALTHAKDLAAAGYLSQLSSDGKSVVDRLSGLEDLSYLGEDSAVGENVDVIRTGMMANAADSANILSETFTRVGVAVVDTGSHGKLAVLEFAG